MSYINNGGGSGGISTITEGVTPTSGFTLGYALTDNGGVVGEAAIRTTLTGVQKFYISATGSDSNDGSIGSPWATIQHAFDFLEATYILAFAIVSFNVDVGTFVGFGTKAQLGSGFIQVLGAGSSQTTIASGPGGSVFNTGECWSGFVFSSVAASADGVTFDVTDVPVGTSGLNFGIPALEAVIGNFLDNSTDVAFVGSTANSYIAMDAAVQVTTVPQGAGTGITLPGGEVCNYGIFSTAEGQLIDSATWYVSAGTLTCNVAFIQLITQSVYLSQSSSFPGSGISGQRFAIVGNSAAISNQGAGALGVNFFPGDAPGLCDASSSYDGFPFAQPTQAGGAPTVADLPDDGSYAAFVDGSGNAYVAMNVAGTIKQVVLT
jgi:hypothetical protein